MAANLTTRLGQLTSSPAGGPYTGANKIINGDMRISQRVGTTSTACSPGVYTLDRWVYQATYTNFNFQQNAGAVTPPAGFTKYFGLTVSSAYTIAAGTYGAIRQIIEGFNIQDLNWGGADAKAITISFWVYSSLTGTFGGVIGNGVGSRSYPFTFAIGSANTWTLITKTIPGDTSGTWSTDNSGTLTLGFNLGTGSTYGSGTPDAWVSANIISPASVVNIVSTNGATFYFTGVKLEVGSIATPFVMDDYEVSFAKCQRYANVMRPNGANAETVGVGRASVTSRGAVYWQFETVMRSRPSITSNFSGAASANMQVAYLNTVVDISSLSVDTRSTRGTVAEGNCSGVLTAGDAVELQWKATASTSSTIVADAEL